MLIDLKRLRLDYVRKGASKIHIGASTTLTGLSLSQDLDGAAHAAVFDALQVTRPIQVKNAATVAGCICSGLPFFDLPVALTALGAAVKVAGSRGSRFVALEKLYLDYFKLDLRVGEFVTEIHLPLFPSRTGSAFEKFSITADDWALVNAAAILTRSKDGLVKSCRIVVGGSVGPTPVRATDAERGLLGRRARHKELERAGELASRQIQPEDDIRASADYRRELCKVLVIRALKKAQKRGEQRG